LTLSISSANTLAPLAALRCRRASASGAAAALRCWKARTAAT